MMKTRKLTFVNFKVLMVLMLSTFLIFSCSKSNKDVPAPGPGDGPQNPNPDPEPDPKDTIVHILGLVGDGQNQDMIIWKDDANSSDVIGNIDLSNSFVSGATVYDGDVYAIGTNFDGTMNSAVYWKNGTMHELTDRSVSSSVGGIVIDENGTLYIGGDDRSGDYGFAVAKFWTVTPNGDVTEDTLTDGTDNAYVSDITLSDGDIYIAGNVKGSIGTYWTNDANTVVTVNDVSMINAIAVRDGKVYLAGNDNISNELRVIADGAVETLSANGGEVTGIALDDDDNVYVIGNTRQNTGDPFSAAYWENGATHYLTDGTKEAKINAITFFGDNVYFAGFEKVDGSPSSHKVAKYWINDDSHVVSLSDENDRGQASGIFVTEE